MHGRRLFGVKCSGCGVGFDNINLVMRARDRVYHVHCFRCITCQCRLVSGDEFALRADDCALVCRQHYDHEADVTVATQLQVPASSTSLTPANSDLLCVVEPRPPAAVQDSTRDVSDEMNVEDSEVTAAARCGGSVKASRGGTTRSPSCTKHISVNDNNKVKHKLTPGCTAAG